MLSMSNVWSSIGSLDDKEAGGKEGWELGEQGGWNQR